VKTTTEEARGAAVPASPVPATVTVTVLVDNARGGEGLRSQWGLSCWIEAGDSRVLLDCGATSAFVRNAAELGVALETADAFVLSHGHYDHGGGLAAVMQAAPRARLVLHPGALVPRYSLRKTGTPEAIGLPERSLAALRGDPERVDWVVRPRQVAPAVWATGPVPRLRPMEEVEPSFHLDEACTVRDLVVDDQTLWVETSRGLVIVFGCAHAGVLNTVDYVRRLAAERSSEAAWRSSVPIADDGLPRVRALLGGMHLLRAGKDRREATVDALASLAPELCGPCHCTGKRATDLLRSRLPEAFVEVRTGSCFELDQGGPGRPGRRR